MDLPTLATLAGGLVLLVAGAEALVRGASGLAATLGVTPLAIGLTVVAFGTSAPELAVSVRGALADAGDVALGNALGSNVFNLLAVLGLCALVGALAVHRRVVRLDLPVLVGVTAVVWLLAADGTVTRTEGVGLAAALLAYTVWVYRASRREERAASTPPEGDAVPSRPWPAAAGAVALGLAVLVVGAQLLVDAATTIAVAAGVGELTVGLTVVAAGTSLPELATSVAAAARGQRDLAVGNVVGSNLFNLLGVLGLSAAVGGGLPVAEQAIRGDLPTSLLATLVVVPFLVTGLVIERWEGGLLLAAYGSYVAVVLLAGLGHPSAAGARLVLWAGLGLVGVVVAAVGSRRRAGSGGGGR